MQSQSRGSFGLLLGVLGPVLLLGGGWLLYRELTATPPGTELAPPPPITGFSLGGDLQETARFLDAPYQLRVDRRFRFARTFSETQKLTEPGVWVQAFPQGQEFDPAEPFPLPISFDDVMSQLTGVKLPEPAAEASLPRFEPGSDPARWIVPVGAALETIRQQTLRGKPVEPLRAAQALISLVFSMPDRLGTADALGGVALAWLAQAEVKDGKPLPAERALLARALGYAETGSRWAQSLPAGAFRAYLTLDDDALARATRLPEGKGLWARRQLELRAPEATEALRAVPRKAQVSWEGVGRTLQARRFEDVRQSASTCPIALELLVSDLAGLDVADLTERLSAAASTAEQERVGSEVRVELIAKNAAAIGLSLDTFSYLGRVERLLERAEKQAGSDVSARLTRDYIISQVTSCMGARISFRFDQLSVSPEARAQEAKDFFDTEQPVFGSIKRWLELRALAHAERRDTAQIIATADSLTELGAGAHSLLFADLTENINYSDPEARQAARYLARKLDTRPAGFAVAARRMAPVLYDKRYTEYYWRNYAREAGRLQPEVVAWWERYQHRTSQDPPGQADELYEASLRAELDLGRDDWGDRQALTRLLGDQGRFEEIPAVVAPWLDLHRRDTGFGREWALSTLALVELERKDPTSAWRVFEPIRESLKFSTLAAGAQIALAKRDLPLAQSFSERALARYPTK